jgi:hypothetical protein
MCIHSLEHAAEKFLAQAYSAIDPQKFLCEPSPVAATRRPDQEARMSPNQLAAIADYEMRLQRPMTPVETAAIAEERATIDKRAARHQAWLADRARHAANKAAERTLIEAFRALSPRMRRTSLRWAREWAESVSGSQEMFELGRELLALGLPIWTVPVEWRGTLFAQFAVLAAAP